MYVDVNQSCVSIVLVLVCILYAVVNVFPAHVVGSEDDLKSNCICVVCKNPAIGKFTLDFRN